MRDINSEQLVLIDDQMLRQIVEPQIGLKLHRSSSLQWKDFLTNDIPLKTKMVSNRIYFTKTNGMKTLFIKNTDCNFGQ